MTIQLRAKTDPTSVTNTTFTVNKPTGTLEGDFMLLVIYASNEALSVPKIGGDWQQVQNGVITGSMGPHCFYRVAGASEPSSYTLTTTASQTLAIGILSFYGDTPLTVDTATFQANASATNRTMPSVTATAAGLYVGLAGLALNFASTPPGGSTEQWDVAIGTKRVYALTAATSGAGATGTYVATGTATISLCVGVHLIEASATGYTCPDLRNWSTTAPSSVASSQTVTIPSDVITGDLLILHAAFDANRTVSDPSGWTALQTIAADGGIWTWWKLAESGDAGATVTVSFSGGTTTVGLGVLAIVSRSGKTLTVGASAQAVSASATTVTLPTVTSTRDNALLIGLISSPDTTGVDIAANSDYLERYDFGSTGVRLLLFTEMLGAAGATGTRALPWTTGSHVGNTVSLTIEEVSEGILYNGNDLRPYLRSWSLEATVGAAKTTVVNSTADEQVALLPSWGFSGEGNWDSTLDDIFGAAVAGSQQANNSLFVEINGEVSYESATCFVAQYKVDTTIDEVLVFQMRIGISGAPTRSVL